MSVASIIIGQLVSRFGKWKGWMVTGSILATIGVSLMATLRYDTPFTLVAVYMFVLGAGLGALTAPLLEAGARVTAVELHPARAARLAAGGWPLAHPAEH